LVPYKEDPLCEFHKSRFDEESFPENLAGFGRIHCAPIDVARQFWPGQQLLVVYASAAYRDEAQPSNPHEAERKKWDDYYSTLPLGPEWQTLKEFNEELVSSVLKLLPKGGKLWRVLDAGSGGGYQSLALARPGRIEVTL